MSAKEINPPHLLLNQHQHQHQQHHDQTHQGESEHEVFGPPSPSSTSFSPSSSQYASPANVPCTTSNSLLDQTFYYLLETQRTCSPPVTFFDSCGPEIKPPMHRQLADWMLEVREFWSKKTLHTWPHTHAHTHVHMHTHIHTHIHLYTHTCTHTHTHACTHTHSSLSSFRRAKCIHAVERCFPQRL